MKKLSTLFLKDPNDLARDEGTEIGQAIDLVIEAVSNNLLLDDVDCANERVHNADLK